MPKRAAGRRRERTEKQDMPRGLSPSSSCKLNTSQCQQSGSGPGPDGARRNPQEWFLPAAREFDQLLYCWEVALETLPLAMFYLKTAIISYRGIHLLFQLCRLWALAQATPCWWLSLMRSVLILNYASVCSLLLGISWGAIMQQVHEIRSRQEPPWGTRSAVGYSIFFVCAVQTFRVDSPFQTVLGDYTPASREHAAAPPMLSIPRPMQELAASALLLSMHDLRQLLFASVVLWSAYLLGVRVDALLPIFSRAATLVVISAAPAGGAFQVAWRLFINSRSWFRKKMKGQAVIASGSRGSPYEFEGGGMENRAQQRGDDENDAGIEECGGATNLSCTLHGLQICLQHLGLTMACISIGSALLLVMGQAFSSASEEMLYVAAVVQVLAGGVWLAAVWSWSHFHSQMSIQVGGSALAAFVCSLVLAMITSRQATQPELTSSNCAFEFTHSIEDPPSLALLGCGGEGGVGTWWHAVHFCCCCVMVPASYMVIGRMKSAALDSAQSLWTWGREELEAPCPRHMPFVDGSVSPRHFGGGGSKKAEDGKSFEADRKCESRHEVQSQAVSVAAPAKSFALTLSVPRLAGPGGVAGLIDEQCEHSSKSSSPLLSPFDRGGGEQTRQHNPELARLSVSPSKSSCAPTRHVSFNTEHDTEEKAVRSQLQASSSRDPSAPGQTDDTPPAPGGEGRAIDFDLLSRELMQRLQHVDSRMRGESCLKTPVVGVTEGHASHSLHTEEEEELAEGHASHSLHTEEEGELDLATEGDWRGHLEDDCGEGFGIGGSRDHSRSQGRLFQRSAEFARRSRYWQPADDASQSSGEAGGEPNPDTYLQMLRHQGATWHLPRQPVERQSRALKRMDDEGELCRPFLSAPDWSASASGIGGSGVCPANSAGGPGYMDIESEHITSSIASLLAEYPDPFPRCTRPLQEGEDVDGNAADTVPKMSVDLFYDSLPEPTQENAARRRTHPPDDSLASSVPVFPRGVKTETASMNSSCSSFLHTDEGSCLWDTPALKSADGTSAPGTTSADAALDDQTLEEDAWDMPISDEAGLAQLSRATARLASVLRHEVCR